LVRVAQTEKSKSFLIQSWLNLLKGKKILVLGVSGFVGFSLALELAKTNEVHGIARFRDESVRRLLEDARTRHQKPTIPP
jgi:NAD(P)-dependent dehydrogenase (short-subunit alcohol dehydrogenase family)